MSLINRQIPDHVSELLEGASLLQVADSGQFDLHFYKWLLGRAFNGVSVELILADAALPESMGLNRQYFKHLADAGARVYSNTNKMAVTAFVLTDRLVLLPDLQTNSQSKTVFREAGNPAAIAKFKLLFEAMKAESSIKSNLFQDGRSEVSDWDEKPEEIEIYFSARPDCVEVNQRFELTWDVKGANHVRIEPLLGNVPVKGSRSLSAEQNTDFRLEAENHSTRLSATASVSVDPRPKIEYLLSVPAYDGKEEVILSPTAGMPDHFGVIKGIPLRLYWRTYNAETLTLDEEALPLTGQLMLAPVAMQLYRISAAGPKGITEISLLIDVVPRPEIMRLDLPPSTPIRVNTVLTLPEQAKLKPAMPISSAHENGEATPPDVHVASAPLGQRIRDFCWFCAGADPSLLTQAPAAERAKYAGIGGAVFFTGLLAALSGGYALFTAFQNWPAALLFGLIWGTLIFNLDRLVVASMKKESDMHTPWLQALPRFLLALVLSMVIAKPLELRIFKPEIDAILADEKREKTLRLEALFDSKIQNFQKRIAGIKAETESFFTIREQLYQEYRCECDGTCGTGRVGRGTECARKETKYRQADEEYQAVKTENDRLISAVRLEADVVTSQKQEALQKWSENRSDGLVARLEASGELPFLPGFFIILLILMVEIAPVLSKLLTPAGVYEHATRLAEAQFVISQEEMLVQEQQLADRKSSLHVRLHTEELNQEVDQKAAVLRLIAEAQMKLVKDQVDDWLEKERGKRRK